MSKKNPDPRDVRVGQNIRLYRLKAGLSQEKLGDAVNITFQQIQKYEKGTNRVSSSRLADFAKVLKVKIGDLFDGIDGNGHADTGRQNLTTRSRLVIIDLLAEIDDPKLETVLVNLLRMMAER